MKFNVGDVVFLRGLGERGVVMRIYGDPPRFKVRSVRRLRFWDRALQELLPATIQRVDAGPRSL